MWLMKCFEATIHTFWKYESMEIYLKALHPFALILFCLSSLSGPLVFRTAVTDRCQKLELSRAPPRCLTHSIWMFDSDFIMSIFGHLSTFTCLISAWVIQFSPLIQISDSHLHCVDREFKEAFWRLESPVVFRFGPCRNKSPGEK